MKPLTAWLGMSAHGGPFVGDKNGRYLVTRERDAAALMPEVEPRRVIIIEDTEDNRRKLGMEVTS